MKIALRGHNDKKDSSKAGLGGQFFLGLATKLSWLERYSCTAGDWVPYSKVLGSNPTGVCCSLATQTV